MRSREDIRVRRATVKAAEKGGWALPGGRITHSQAEAMWVCVEMDRLIAEDAFDEDNRQNILATRKRRADLNRPLMA